jgi:hypothetical protein
MAQRSLKLSLRHLAICSRRSARASRRWSSVAVERQRTRSGGGNSRAESPSGRPERIIGPRGRLVTLTCGIRSYLLTPIAGFRRQRKFGRIRQCHARLRLPKRPGALRLGSELCLRRYSSRVGRQLRHVRRSAAHLRAFRGDPQTRGRVTPCLPLPWALAQFAAPDRSPSPETVSVSPRRLAGARRTRCRCRSRRRATVWPRRRLRPGGSMHRDPP